MRKFKAVLVKRLSITAVAILMLLAPLYAAASFNLPVRQVSPNIYVVIGELGPPTYENDGLNVNLGFVVPNAGVVVIDTGPSVRVARALHDAIRRVTNQPIAFVINTNSQGHRWLGNAYFRDLGVPIIAHQETLRLMKEEGGEQLVAAVRVLREKADGTKLAFPTETIDSGKVLQQGTTEIHLMHFGSAHTAGDLVAWLPRERTVFAGDVVFTDRLPAVLAVGNSRQWIAAYDAVMALQPGTIIPGHGLLTNGNRGVRETRGYLAFLREAVKNRLHEGVSLVAAIDGIDQSAFSDLVNFKILAKRNAQQIYTEMEFE